MANKTALITGASSGVGQAIARILSTSGYNIAAHYFSNISAMKLIEEEVGENSVRLEAFRYDLRKPEQAKEMVADVVKRLGGINVLINTIGPFYLKDISEITPEEWAEVINMNLNIAFNVSYYAREELCASKGSIVNFAFSGVEQLRAWTTGTAYSAAKAGVVVFSKSLAASLAPIGVRVNCICSGVLEEDMPELKRQSMVKLMPVGRLGKPDEIAQVVKWLVTESPSYLTGSVIAVAGAWEQ